MSRQPFQTLIIPYRYRDKELEVCVFKRSKQGWWQGVSGGGEDKETPIETAKRELFEETKLSKGEIIKLANLTMIPAANVCGLKWGDELYLVPEFSFAYEVVDEEIQLSHEHSEYKWTSCADAMSLLKFESNRNAVWELQHILANGLSSENTSLSFSGHFKAI